MKSSLVADFREDKQVSSSYSFGGIHVDLSRRTVLRDDQEAHIRIRSFEVLIYLIDRRERLVTKEELLDGFWTKTAVTENSLVQCIIEIRKTLGDDARNPRFIKSIPKAGYQFIGILDAARGASLVAGPSPRFYRPRIWAVAALLTVSLAALAWRVSRRPEIVLPHVDGKRSVAVLYFENQSGNKDLDWLRQGLADMLISRLSQSRDVSVLGRLELGSLFDRLDISRNNPIRWEDAVHVADKSHAELAILGSFARLGDKIRIAAEVHDPKSGRVLAAESVTADRLE